LPALVSAQSASPSFASAAAGTVTVATGAAVPARTDTQIITAPVKVPATPATTKPAVKLSRWLEFQAASVGTRYRYVETSVGVVSARQIQDNSQLKVRFKFDPKSRFSVTALFATGSAFTGGWNTTGIGTGDFVKMMPLKQIYVSLAPVSGVEASFGSLGFVRGEATEITTYDNDGYLAGERISIKRPKALFFDEISATSAFLGDKDLPAFWDRADRLTGERNYFQYVVSKRITKTVSASADYTRLSGVATYRVAVGAKTPKAGIVDAMRYEQYVRTGDADGKGFAVSADKAITKRFSGGVGFATIDPLYGGLNADRFNKGKRLFQSASVKVTPDFSLQLFMTQAIDNDYAVGNRYRFDVIASYNVLGALQRAGYLK
jgi:hypothetical protein